MKKVKIVAAFIMTITLSMSVIPPLVSISQHTRSDNVVDTTSTPTSDLKEINRRSLQFLERAESKTGQRLQNYEYYKNKLLQKLKADKKKVVIETKDTVYVPVIIRDTVVIEKKKYGFFKRLFRL